MTEQYLNKTILEGNTLSEYNKRIRRNDIRWLITLIASILAAVFMMDSRPPVVIDNSKEVKMYCDSLQLFVDTSMYVEGFKGR